MKNAEYKLTQNGLKELLSYDPETGIFKWKVNRGRLMKDSVAGSKMNIGYFQIKINYRKYLSHRLAFLYVYGRFPKGQIDHINGVRDDNRIENLRDVTRTVNNQNTKRTKNNTSGFTGVYWHKAGNKWVSRINVNKKNVHLGSFSCIGEAIMARKKANIEYGFHENHGRG